MLLRFRQWFTDIRLYFISVVFSYSYFWISLAIPYLSWRGLSGVQTFSLMSIYQIAGVLIEYPTSVLGDRYGYRRTVILGNIFSAISMFVLVQPGSYWYYAFGLFLNAVGTSLMSGNEQGMLKEISTSVRRDTALRSSVSEFVLFLSAIIGGWLGGISYVFALYISGGLMLSTVFPILAIRTRRVQHPNPPNTLTIIKDGLSSFQNPIFQQLFMILAIFGGFFFTIKSIYGSFGELYEYPVEQIGIIVGLGALFRSAGSAIYAKYDQIIKLPLLIIMSIMIAVLAISSPLFMIIILLLFQLLVGYVLSAIDGDIQDLAADHIRSSLFSFKRLIMRLFSSVYLLIYGYMVDVGKLSLMMLSLGLVMGLSTYLTRNYSRINLGQK